MSTSTSKYYKFFFSVYVCMLLRIIIYEYFTFQYLPTYFDSYINQTFPI